MAGSGADFGAEQAGWVARTTGAKAISFWEFFKQTELGQAMTLPETEQEFLTAQEVDARHSVYRHAYNIYNEISAYEAGALVQGAREVPNSDKMLSKMRWGVFPEKPKGLGSRMYTEGPQLLDAFVKQAEDHICQLLEARYAGRTIG